MISKIPRWMWFGSSVLAFIAGIINTIGLLGFQHQGVTHLTGSTTLLGIAIAHGDVADALRLLAIIMSFMAGCIFGGVLIQDSTLKLGRRYGVALLIESCLLFAAVPFLWQSNSVGDYLASCACGLQNGMVSTYSGAVLRTTHVSGSFTDLGVFIGHLIRGLKVDWQRIEMCVILITSFLAGAVAGAIGFGWFSYNTLYFPASATGFVGLAYWAYWYHSSKKKRLTEKISPPV